MKIAVIADRGVVQRFALDALDTVEGTHEITVYSCTNSRRRIRWLKNGAYYLLNLMAVRNALTRFVPLASSVKRIVRQVEFETDYDGSWQVLPAQVIRDLRAGSFDVILKFGMGLLRVPPEGVLATPILSYHHGDPDRYRGRPAGFWEMMDRSPVMGQVVQVITNKLDAGIIVARAETKVFPWSYRKTLIESYRHSPLIINEAIRRAKARTCLHMPCHGRNCRLPSNGRVFAFVLRMAARLLGRIGYGALFEKSWRVSTAAIQGASVDELIGGAFPPASQWRDVPTAPQYRFYADPFFCRNRRAILVEALLKGSEMGDIVLIEGDSHRCVSNEVGHMSYPATIDIEGSDFVVPETAQWSTPRIYKLKDTALELHCELRSDNPVAIVDPTLLMHEGSWYLFGNSRPHGNSVLDLWWAQSLEAVFRKHPSSPIRISPRGSRPGGGFLRAGGSLFRFGQDFTGKYGDGLVVFEVQTLSPDDFGERELGTIRFEDVSGPHTLNFREGEVVFDWYRERLAPMAGLRRLRAWANGKRQLTRA